MDDGLVCGRAVTCEHQGQLDELMIALRGSRATTEVRQLFVETPYMHRSSPKGPQGAVAKNVYKTLQQTWHNNPLPPIGHEHN